MQEKQRQYMKPLGQAFPDTERRNMFPTVLPAEEWWGVLENYGIKIWPAQIGFFAAAVVIVLMVFLKPGRTADRLLKLYMALSFGWIGAVFFLTLGKGLVGNYLFGSLFVVVAVLFAVDLFRQRMMFHPPNIRWQWNLTTLLGIIILCYPAFSLLVRHQFPRTVYPGTFPCPTTALALLLLTFALPRVDKIIYFILVFWAIPFPLLIQIPRYGVYEDIIMFAVGVYSLIMLVRDWTEKPVPDRGMQPLS